MSARFDRYSPSNKVQNSLLARSRLCQAVHAFWCEHEPGSFYGLHLVTHSESLARGFRGLERDNVGLDAAVSALERLRDDPFALVNSGEVEREAEEDDADNVCDKMSPEIHPFRPWTTEEVCEEGVWDDQRKAYENADVCGRV